MAKMKKRTRRAVLSVSTKDPVEWAFKGVVGRMSAEQRYEHTYHGGLPRRTRLKAQRRAEWRRNNGLENE